MLIFRTPIKQFLNPPQRHSSLQNEINNLVRPVAALPPLYIITPTFRRGEQLAELTRLGYTLKHLANLFWLVVEDSEKPTPAVTKLLTRIGVPFAHLVGE